MLPDTLELLKKASKGASKLEAKRILRHGASILPPSETRYDCAWDEE